MVPLTKRKTHSPADKENKPPQSSKQTSTKPRPSTISQRVWSTLSSPILTSPNANLKLTWHLHNPSPRQWIPPIVLSMLICKHPVASAMLGATEGSLIPADQILLRTKFDLDAHEERYEYLSETVLESIISGESIDVVAEISIPSQLGNYWGCFKIFQETDKEFYCVFRYVSLDMLILELQLQMRMSKEMKIPTRSVIKRIC
jgi:hypothetical protein